MGDCRTRAWRKDTGIPGAGVMGPRRDHRVDRKGTRGVQRLRSRQIGGGSQAGVWVTAKMTTPPGNVGVEVAKVGRWASRGQRPGSQACSLKSLQERQSWDNKNWTPGTTVLIRD